MAATLPSVREQIFQGMLRALQSVTVDNGYELTLGYCARGDFGALDLRDREFPAALILPISDEPESGAYNVNRRQLVCAVRVLVKKRTGTATELETALTAVSRAMMTNPLWGGLADTSDEGGTHYLMLDNQYEEAGADISYIVHYRTTVWDLTMPPMNLQMTGGIP